MALKVESRESRQNRQFQKHSRKLMDQIEAAKTPERAEASKAALLGNLVKTSSAEDFVRMNRDISTGQAVLQSFPNQSIDQNVIIQIDPTIYMTDAQDSKISQTQDSKGPLDTSSRHFSDLPQLPEYKMKIPSYATCLRAEIQPKNFKLLREYYTLLAKDANLAHLNRKKMLQGVVDQPPASLKSRLSDAPGVLMP